MDKFSSAYYDLVEEKLYTAVLADIMDRMGRQHQTMSYQIRPLYPGARVVGRAATMLAADVYHMPEEPYKLELVLLDDLKPGEVVVCTTQGSTRSAIWGELLSTHARAKGARGTVMDGLTRDAERIIAMAFPVFTRGLTPADSYGRTDVIAIRVPIEAGGVPVHNGDLVVADFDGCLTVPQDIEEEVVRRALEKVSGENKVREILRKGASIQEVFDEYGIL